LTICIASIDTWLCGESVELVRASYWNLEWSHRHAESPPNRTVE